MITDNDKNNYIVRPVKKRTIKPVKKKTIKKKIIKDNIDDDRLDNSSILTLYSILEFYWPFILFSA